MGGACLSFSFFFARQWRVGEGWTELTILHLDFVLMVLYVLLET